MPMQEQNTGNGRSTLALKPMGRVNSSLRQRVPLAPYNGDHTTNFFKKSKVIIQLNGTVAAFCCIFYFCNEKARLCVCITTCFLFSCVHIFYPGQDLVPVLHLGMVRLLNLNVNGRVLCSEYQVFLRPMYNECSQSQSLLLCHASMSGSHSLPDQLPGEHTGPHHILCSILSNNHLQCCHTYTHSFMIDRSTVVKHVLTVDRCSVMCTNHIDMIAHTQTFLWVRQYPCMVSFSHVLALPLVGLKLSSQRLLQ